MSCQEGEKLEIGLVHDVKWIFGCVVEWYDEIWKHRIQDHGNIRFRP
jgi:hypothetical protein